MRKQLIAEFKCIVIFSPNCSVVKHLSLNRDNLNSGHNGIEN